MTKAQARAWRERWRVINDLAIQEARALTLSQRLRQLAALFDFAHRLSPGGDDLRQVEQVRRRWLRLKEQDCE